MRSALRLAIEQYDTEWFHSLPRERFSEMIAFNVRFAKTSTRMRRDAIYYAVYRVFEDHRNGKDLEQANEILFQVAQHTKFESGTQLFDFITKHAYYHATGKNSPDLDVHITCWWHVMYPTLGRNCPVQKCFDYALDQIEDRCQLFTSDDFDLSDREWRAQRKHTDGIWLQVILNTLFDKSDYQSNQIKFNIIHASILLDFEETLLSFICREVFLPSDLRLSYGFDSRTALHECVTYPNLKPYQLRELLKDFDPQHLDDDGRRPSEVLSTLTPSEHTEELLAILRASEEIHEPSRRDLMVVMGHSLPMSCSMFSWLDNELIRMITEYARLDYRSPFTKMCYPNGMNRLPQAHSGI
jgi:hypothetical protein